MICHHLHQNFFVWFEIELNSKQNVFYFKLIKINNFIYYQLIRNELHGLNFVQGPSWWPGQESNFVDFWWSVSELEKRMIMVSLDQWNLVNVVHHRLHIVLPIKTIRLPIHVTLVTIGEMIFKLNTIFLKQFHSFIAILLAAYNMVLYSTDCIFLVPKECRIERHFLVI